MFLQLLCSVDFWIGVVAMLVLMCLAGLFFIVADVLSSRAPVQRPRPRTALPPKHFFAHLGRNAKRWLPNAAGFSAVAAFWALLLFSALTPQP